MKAKFESEWTEAEAVAEKERDFGSVPLEECEQVCDVCYQQISPQNNSEYYKRYLNTPPPTQTVLDDTKAIRAYVDAEISRKLNEWIDREFATEYN